VYWCEYLRYFFELGWQKKLGQYLIKSLQERINHAEIDKKKWILNKERGYLDSWNI